MGLSWTTVIREWAKSGVYRRFFSSDLIAIDAVGKAAAVEDPLDALFADKVITARNEIATDVFPDITGDDGVPDFRSLPCNLNCTKHRRGIIGNRAVRYKEKTTTVVVNRRSLERRTVPAHSAIPEAQDCAPTIHDSATK